MSAPVRIQRRRTGGWRMPAGAVFVGRGTRWGNPFTAGMNQNLRMVAVKARPDDETNASGDMVFRDLSISRATAISLYRDALQPLASPAWSAQPLDVTVDDVRRDLAGHDLACWCPIDQPCHADVLLELANESEGGRG